MTHSSRAQLATLGLCAALLLASGCGHCKREVCGLYETEIEALASANPSGALADHLLVFVSEAQVSELAEQVASAISEQVSADLAGAVEIPGGEASVSAEIGEVRLEDSPRGAGVTLGVHVSIQADIRNFLGTMTVGAESSATVSTVLRVDPGDPSRLVVVMGDSEIRDVVIEPVGVEELGALGGPIAAVIEQTANEFMTGGGFAALGEVVLARFRPIEVSPLAMSLYINSLAVDPETNALVVGLRTDLEREIALEPRDVALPGEFAVAVAMPPDLVPAIVEHTLAQDGGQRFNGHGEPDDGGALGVILDLMEPTDDGLITFGYRMFRLSVPCILATFEGTANLAVEDERAQVDVEMELLGSTRLERLVRKRIPERHVVNAALTEMLTNILTFDAVSLPGGAAARFLPESSRVDSAGYLIVGSVGVGQNEVDEVPTE